MERSDVLQIRERFGKEVQATASDKSIPIQRLSWRDVPEKDASELIIESGGKRREFTFDNGDLATGAVRGEIEVIINTIIDNE